MMEALYAFVRPGWCSRGVGLPVDGIQCFRPANRVDSVFCVDYDQLCLPQMWKGPHSAGVRFSEAGFLADSSRFLRIPGAKPSGRTEPDARAEPDASGSLHTAPWRRRGHQCPGSAQRATV
jgi:hypothetical protein